MESITVKITDNTMDAAGKRLRDMIRPLTDDEITCLFALMQCKLVDEFGDNEHSAVPDYMTKSRCKRIIKAIRETQSEKDACTRQRGNRIIAHIRNVWIPQIMQRKAG